MRTDRVAAMACVLACAVPLAACSSGDTGSRYAACAEPGAAEKSRILPHDMPLLAEAELTDVTTEKGFVAISGIATDATVDNLYDSMVRTVRDNGFDVLSQENEGFEAEVYFSRSTDVAGMASLRKGPCPSQVTYSVLYDPLETKKAKRITAKTRRAASS